MDDHAADARAKDGSPSEERLGEPAAKEPAAGEPAADEPAADEPAAEEPAADEGEDAIAQGGVSAAEAADTPPLEALASAESEASEPSEVPAPPESSQTESVAPPPPIEAPASRAAGGIARGGWSAGTLRTVGWITFAVSLAAGAGLSAAGIAACNGQGLGCIQGQPLVWSGAVVGLSGIPVGLTLVVRGGRVTVAPQGAVALGGAAARGRPVFGL